MIPHSTITMTQMDSCLKITRLTIEIDLTGIPETLKDEVYHLSAKIDKHKAEMIRTPSRDLPASESVYESAHKSGSDTDTDADSNSDMDPKSDHESGSEYESGTGTAPVSDTESEFDPEPALVPEPALMSVPVPVPEHVLELYTELDYEQIDDLDTNPDPVLHQALDYLDTSRTDEDVAPKHKSARRQLGTYFNTGQRIKFKDSIGVYDGEQQKIMHDGTAYSLSGFAKQASGSSKCNGWTQCKYEVGATWKSMNTLK